jgi:hypothetical protein
MKAGHFGLPVAAHQAQEDTGSIDQDDCPSNRGLPGALEHCLSASQHQVILASAKC